jgi:hypothetical protein
MYPWIPWEWSRIPWDMRSTLGEPLAACGFECPGCKQVTTSNGTPVGTPHLKKPQDPLPYSQQNIIKKKSQTVTVRCFWLRDRRNSNTVFETLPSPASAQITKTTYLPWLAWGTAAEGAAAGIRGDSRGIPSPLHPRDFPQQRPPHGK